MYVFISICNANANGAAFTVITAKSGNSPVAANSSRNRGQLEDEGPHIGVGICIRGRHVNPGVGACALAHLGLTRYQHGCVVVHVDQVDLEGSRPTGLRRA